MDRDDKVFWGFVSAGALILAIVGFLVYYGYQETRFYFLEPVEVECTLLESRYSASTQKTRVAPVASSNGRTAVAVYTTGKPESKITVWDCGMLGRLVSNDGAVYRFAKEESILLIKSNSYDTRIVGIVTGEWR